MADLCAFLRNKKKTRKPVNQQDKINCSKKFKLDMAKEPRYALATLSMTFQSKSGHSFLKGGWSFDVKGLSIFFTVYSIMLMKMSISEQAIWSEGRKALDELTIILDERSDIQGVN